MKSKKINVLVISFSPLNSDPRVRRQLAALSDKKYKIVAAGLTDPNIDGVEWLKLTTPIRNRLERYLDVLKLKLHLYGWYYKSHSPVRELLKLIKEDKSYFDVVIANDIDALPIALRMPNNPPVFLDAHEFSPEEMGGRLWKFVFSRYKDWQCRTFLPKAALMSTVCEGISELYEKRYGKKSILMLNSPKYEPLMPLVANDNKVKLVHHGGAHRSRGLETMIEMMEYLDDKFILNFYLVANHEASKNYLNELKRLAKKYGERVIFHNPVETENIAGEINKYDIGVYPLMPSSTNDKLALPNKFFEFIQARLAIAIGPSPEMVKLLNKFDLGVVADDFSAEAMAKVIRNLSSDDIARYKYNADKAAMPLSFDSQTPLFLESVQHLIEEN